MIECLLLLWPFGVVEDKIVSCVVVADLVVVVVEVVVFEPEKSGK